MKFNTQEIFDAFFKEKEIKVFMRRLDLINSPISGNKYFKLKYNISKALEEKNDTIVTFGGAYSNHILATSIISKEVNIKCIGYIRGEKTLPLNPTLNDAINNGMQIRYISRKEYKRINNEDYLNFLKQKHKNSYIIPEGGTNKLAVKGAELIINSDDNFQFICCPIGTGGTISGIINSSSKNQQIIGFSSIKGVNKIIDDIDSFTNKNNWKINDDYSLGGYAKVSSKLINFIYDFYEDKNIALDAVYTGKMMMGIIDLILNDNFPKGSNILVIHTGGIQGNRGINERYDLNLPHNF